MKPPKLQPIDHAYLHAIFPGLAHTTRLPLARLQSEYREHILPHGPDKAGDPARPVCDLLVDLAGNCTTVAEYRDALLHAAQTLVTAARSLPGEGQG